MYTDLKPGRMNLPFARLSVFIRVHLRFLLSAPRDHLGPYSLFQPRMNTDVHGFETGTDEFTLRAFICVYPCPSAVSSFRTKGSSWSIQPISTTDEHRCTRI